MRRAPFYLPHPSTPFSVDCLIQRLYVDPFIILGATAPCPWPAVHIQGTSHATTLPGVPPLWRSVTASYYTSCLSELFALFSEVTTASSSQKNGEHTSLVTHRIRQPFLLYWALGSGYNFNLKYFHRCHSDSMVTAVSLEGLTFDKYTTFLILHVKSAKKCKKVQNTHYHSWHMTFFASSMAPTPRRFTLVFCSSLLDGTVLVAKTGMGSSAALISSLVGSLLVFFGAARLACLDSAADQESTEARLCGYGAGPGLNESLDLTHNLAQACHCVAQGKVSEKYNQRMIRRLQMPNIIQHQRK